MQPMGIAQGAFLGERLDVDHTVGLVDDRGAGDTDHGYDVGIVIGVDFRSGHRLPHADGPVGCDDGPIIGIEAVHHVGLGGDDHDIDDIPPDVHVRGVERLGIDLPGHRPHIEALEGGGDDICGSSGNVGENLYIGESTVRYYSHSS